MLIGGDELVLWSLSRTSLGTSDSRPCSQRKGLFDELKNIDRHKLSSMIDT